MSVLRVKKNDVVIATSGAQAGKSGKVMQVIPEKGRALVEGVNLVKKAVRKSQERPNGGIIEKEATLHLSNLMLYCPHCKKGVKVRAESDGSRKVRKCKKCGHSFDG